MNNKLIEKLHNDLEKLETRYNNLWDLDNYERERKVQDQEYLGYLRKTRIEVLNKISYIKELLEVANEEAH